MTKPKAVLCFITAGTEMIFEMIGLKICGVGHGCNRFVFKAKVAAPQ